MNHFSLISDYLRELTHHQNIYMSDCDQNLKKRSLIQIQRALVKCQELGDEKLSVVATIIETIENRSRQLEQDLENLGMFIWIVYFKLSMLTYYVLK